MVKLYTLFRSRLLSCLRLRTLETIPSSAAHKCFSQKKGVPLGVENRCHRFPECTIVLDVSGLLLWTILDMIDILNSVIVILASTFLKKRGRTLIFYLVHSFSFFHLHRTARFSDIFPFSNASVYTFLKKGSVPKFRKATWNLMRIPPLPGDFLWVKGVQSVFAFWE